MKNLIMATALIASAMFTGAAEAQKTPLLPEKDVVALANELSGEDLPLCGHRTRAGRPCQLPVLDASSGLCFRHAGLRTPKKDPDDLSAELLDKVTEFHTPYEVNEFLAKLLFLLVRNRISAKRAGALTYIAARLLHSLGLVRLVEKAEKDEPIEIICDGPRPQRD